MSFIRSFISVVWNLCALCGLFGASVIAHSITMDYLNRPENILRIQAAQEQINSLEWNFETADAAAKTFGALTAVQMVGMITMMCLRR